MNNLKKIKTIGAITLAFLLSFSAYAETKNTEYLIKIAADESKNVNFMQDLKSLGLKQEALTDEWLLVTGPSAQIKTLLNSKSSSVIQYVQPNYKISLMDEYKLEDPLRRVALQRFLSRNPSLKENKAARGDNPTIPQAPSNSSGNDPLFEKQWGMLDIGTVSAWDVSRGNNKVIVAVIDTGVDYTHEDLLPNIWRNPGETGKDAMGRDKSANGIDDDNNGYVDDVIGWDFAKNDNKPYDLASGGFSMMLGGGNPGHGTHCAGNVAARGQNGMGISGVAPNAQIMPLRFISEKGQGTTAGAIKAIKYAVDNGAKVLSNSWGSEGENPREGEENKALQDAIAYAQGKGVLFVAAAGNGHKSKGYDNDTDPRPAYPASYAHDNIISVAAIDSSDQLGTFSNWGVKSVDIGAPGVKVYSTMVGNKYSDMVSSSLGMKVTWDGTSMSCPHVAGAAALYWSAHPEKTAAEVKAALLGSVKKTNSLANKTVSGGKLDVQSLMKY